MASTNPLIRPQKLVKAIGKCAEAGAFRCETIDEHPVAVMYDEDLLIETAKLVSRSFLEQSEGGIEFLHCSALKACPLAGVGAVLASVNEQDLGGPSAHGAECASIGEIVVAQKHFKPSQIVYDSPCKTIPELKYTLNNKIHLNIDSIQELERVKRLYESGEVAMGSSVGLRINPLVGAGTLAMFSVATTASKFGVPISQITAKEIASLPWINCLMLHSGSHGCGLDLLVSGVAKVTELAVEVNQIAVETRGVPQIDTFDIGGGIPAINTGTDAEICEFTAYAQGLKKSCPELFSGKFIKRIISEFGASMFARSGWVVSQVEYTKEIVDEDERRKTLVILHAGADLFLRRCYTGAGNHPISLHSPNGELVPPVPAGEKAEKHSTFGPLCFSGDELSEKKGSIEFGRQAVPGDLVAMHNAGANVYSLFSHHCSRNAPKAFLFAQDGEGVSVRMIRSEDTTEQTAKFWGAVSKQ